MTFAMQKDQPHATSDADDKPGLCVGCSCAPCVAWCPRVVTGSGTPPPAGFPPESWQSEPVRAMIEEGKRRARAIRSNAAVVNAGGD